MLMATEIFETRHRGMEFRALTQSSDPSPKEHSPWRCPTDVPIIDCMISFPIEDKKELYEFITKQTKDSQSKDEFSSRSSTCSRTCPTSTQSGEDPVAVTLREMDKHNIEKGLIGIGSDELASARWSSTPTGSSPR